MKNTTPEKTPGGDRINHHADKIKKALSTENGLLAVIIVASLALIAAALLLGGFK